MEKVTKDYILDNSDYLFFRPTMTNVRYLESIGCTRGDWIKDWDIFIEHPVNPIRAIYISNNPQGEIHGVKSRENLTDIDHLAVVNTKLWSKK